MTIIVDNLDAEVLAILNARFGSGDEYPVEALLVARELDASIALLGSLANDRVDRETITRPGVTYPNHGIRLGYVHELLAAGFDQGLVRNLLEYLAITDHDNRLAHVQAFWKDAQAVRALYADRAHLAAFLMQLAITDPEMVLSHSGQIRGLVGQTSASRIMEAVTSRITRIQNHRQFQEITSLRRHYQIVAAARVDSLHPWNLVLKGYVLGKYPKRAWNGPQFDALFQELRHVMADERPAEAPARWRWLAEGFRLACGTWENGLAAMEQIDQLKVVVTAAGLVFQPVHTRPIPGGLLLEVPLRATHGQVKLRHTKGRRGEQLRGGDTVIVCAALVDGLEPNFQASGGDTYVLELHSATRPTRPMFADRTLAIM